MTGRGRPVNRARATRSPQASATAVSIAWILPRKRSARSCETHPSSSSRRAPPDGSRRIPLNISPIVRQLIDKSTVDRFAIQRTTFAAGFGLTSSDRTLVSRRYCIFPEATNPHSGRHRVVVRWRSHLDALLGRAETGEGNRPDSRAPLTVRSRLCSRRQPRHDCLAGLPVVPGPKLGAQPPKTGSWLFRESKSPSCHLGWKS